MLEFLYNPSNSSVKVISTVNKSQCQIQPRRAKPNHSFPASEKIEEDPDLVLDGRRSRYLKDKAH
jgi:hypothetical protein